MTLKKNTISLFTFFCLSLIFTLSGCSFLSELGLKTFKENKNKGNLEAVVIQYKTYKITLESYTKKLLSYLSSTYQGTPTEEQLKIAKVLVTQNIILDISVRENPDFSPVDRKRLDSYLNELSRSYGGKDSFRTGFFEQGVPYQEWVYKLEGYLRLREQTNASNKIGLPPGSYLHIDQIVLPTEAKAKQIRSVLRRNPSRFSELAKKYSLGPESSQGGVVGWVERRSFPPFYKAYKETRMNRFSEVINSPFGFHIIRVNKTKTVKERDKGRKSKKRKNSKIDQKNEAQVSLIDQSKLFIDWSKINEIRFFTTGLICGPI